MTDEPDQETIDRRSGMADAAFGCLVNLADWFWIAAALNVLVAFVIAYLLGWVGH